MTGFKQANFLGRAEIEDVINEVAEIAEKDRITVALAGGAAMQVYGSDRMTKDVDFLASHEPSRSSFSKNWRLKPLSFGGVSSFSKKKVPVDFIVRNDDQSSLYEEALSEAVDGGGPIRVVSSEHLAVIKLAAGRIKDEEDLRFLLAAKAINLAKTRSITKKFLGFYGVDCLNSFVDEVEWRLASENKKKGQ